jgi:thiosulfate reductase cytochrome b subunit
MSIPETAAGTSGADRQGERIIRRHRLSTRIWHWVNVAAMLIMLMSGLMILNAHPRLYWGEYGANPDTPWLEIGSMGQSGYLRVGGLMIDTTGVLGVWTDGSGNTQYTAFPGWATIPSTYDLAQSRHWHLSFAWLFFAGIAGYLVWSVINGHLWRDLLPRRAELAPGNIWTDIKHHATLRFPTGEAASRYNILQKLAYVAVLFILLPTLVLTGLTMSPAMTTAWPWLLGLFFGRQSARSLHFICASLVVLFVVVHLLMVLLAGPVNEIISMITGRFRLPKEKN